MSSRPILDLLMAREKQRLDEEMRKRIEWEEQRKSNKRSRLLGELNVQAGSALVVELGAEIKQAETYPYDAWIEATLSPSAHLEIGETREPDEGGHRAWFVALRGNAVTNSVDYVAFTDGENDDLRSAIARAALRILHGKEEE